MFDGQYSAYSSHVQPVDEQHSAVMELAGPSRRRLRRVRNICVASRGSSHAVESANTNWKSSFIGCDIYMRSYKSASSPRADRWRPPRTRPAHRCVAPCGRYRCRKPSTGDAAVSRGIACDSRDATLSPSPHAFWNSQYSDANYIEISRLGIYEGYLQLILEWKML